MVQPGRWEEKQPKSQNRRVLREECGTESNGINGSNNGVGDGSKAAGPMKQPTMLCGSTGLGDRPKEKYQGQGQKAQRKQPASFPCICTDL